MISYGLNALTTPPQDGVQRNNYTGPSLYGFHVWSDATMLCAKPDLVVAVNQANTTWASAKEQRHRHIYAYTHNSSFCVCVLSW